MAGSLRDPDSDAAWARLRRRQDVERRARRSRYRRAIVITGLLGTPVAIAILWALFVLPQFSAGPPDHPIRVCYKLSCTSYAPSLYRVALAEETLLLAMLAIVPGSFGVWLARSLDRPPDARS